jgi:uncharacterized protein DUF6491
MKRAVPTAFRLATALLPLLAGASVLGQDDQEGAFDRTPQDCITVTRIDQVEAVDDQNLLFKLRGHNVYRNTLPSKCPNLARENRIAYETRTSRLCKVDLITVLESYGVGFRPGFTCRLGAFVPLSPAEVEDLELLKKGEVGQRAIETTEVEVERADEATEAANPAEAAADEAAPATEAAPAPPDDKK